ncbi:MAG: glycosyltransferase [Betaproteobacteria bacterium HGW-Betaproteobacteria-8]|nr:MAG: glycosyltransferase [Betaproteobacteria bacterium HGW-Betaproteobacteria-8]
MTSNALFQSAFEQHRNGQLAQAESAYLQFIACQPRNAAALHLLGLLYQQTGRHAQAVELIAQALDIEPNNPDYLNNYGAALRANGQTEQAIHCYRKALQITPKDLDLQNNLGNACLELHRYEEAAGCYRRVLRAVPQDQDVRAALCHALQSYGFQCHDKGMYIQAEAAYEEAIQLNPRIGAYYYNLGNAQRELGKTEAALKSYQQALKLMPDDADVYNNLGNALRETGKLKEAIEAYQHALQLNPQLYHAKVHLVHQKQHACDWNGLEPDILEIRHWVTSVPEAQVSPFAFLAMPTTTPEEQKQCADNWVKNRFAQLLEAPQVRAFEANASHKKLRIAYLSSDFRLHPLAFLISELIESHDRKRFEIHAYSNAPDDKTPERKRLEKAFDHFVDIRTLSITDAASRIQKDQIDILVDLTGFTQASRSAIAALRPAPISINWLGYPGTMGSYHDRPLFDYILTDNFVTPENQNASFAETTLRLPLCYQPNDSKRPVGKATSRAENSLPEDSFVFCCFNQTFKIIPQVFDIWINLLKERPGSVLWLLECNALAKENLQREAEARGVAANRLVFAPRMPIAEHLARHRLADLFLDTLPYNAHTTASDALWMGLPLLTCTGQTFASRVAGSLLHALGMDELITNTLQAYEQKALQLSADKALLDSLKQQLQTNRDNSPLFDTRRFTKDLEQRYEDVWQRYLAGQ